MALSASPGPVRAGLDLVRGSVEIVALRAGLLLLAALPALGVTLFGLQEGAARQPYYTDLEGRLPGFHLLRLLGDLPPLFAPMALLAILLALLGEQALVGGALGWLAPDRDRETPARATRSVLREGVLWLWPMLRVLCCSVALAASGLLGLHLGVEHLIDRGEPAGWTGHTLVVMLPGLRLIASVLWLALVGAGAFWCRVLMIADSRRTVRSAGLLALCVMWRRWLVGPLFYIGLSLASQVGSAVVLVVWRQTPPLSLLGALCYGGTWLLVLVLQAFLWHWLLRAARLHYARAIFDDVRARPDGPLGVVSALRRGVRGLLPRRGTSANEGGDL